jgi:hypothetical protein
MQDPGHQNRYRPGQIKQPMRLDVGENLAWFAGIPPDRRDTWAGRQQRARMAEGHRINIDIDHGCLGDDPPGDLMHVVHGGQAAADIQELADALLGAVAYRPHHERALLAGAPRAGGDIRHDLLGKLPVSGEVILPAEHVVIDPGHVRDGRIKPRTTFGAGVTHTREHRRTNRAATVQTGIAITSGT